MILEHKTIYCIKVIIWRIIFSWGITGNIYWILCDTYSLRVRERNNKLYQNYYLANTFSWGITDNIYWILCDIFWLRHKTKTQRYINIHDIIIYDTLFYFMVKTQNNILYQNYYMANTFFLRNNGQYKLDTLWYLFFTAKRNEQYIVSQLLSGE